jgi:hypothetical protein
MTTHVNDGGTWRQLVSLGVNDSGTWRDLQEVYVNDSGTWRLVFSRTVTLTITPAAGNDGAVFSWIGFIDGTTGSVSPAGPNNIHGSRTLNTLDDVFPFGGGAYQFSQFAVSGFGADPGQTGYFNNIVCNGVTRTAAGATGALGGSIAAYSYSSGTGIWTWDTGAFGLSAGVNKDLTINF